MGYEFRKADYLGLGFLCDGMKKRVSPNAFWLVIILNFSPLINAQETIGIEKISAKNETIITRRFGIVKFENVEKHPSSDEIVDDLTKEEFAIYDEWLKRRTENIKLRNIELDKKIAQRGRLISGLDFSGNFSMSISYARLIKANMPVVLPKRDRFDSIISGFGFIGADRLYEKIEIMDYESAIVKSFVLYSDRQMASEQYELFLKNLRLLEEEGAALDIPRAKELARKLREAVGISD